MKKIIAMILAVAMLLSVVPALADEENVFYRSVYFEELNWDPAYWTDVNDTGLGANIYETLFEYQEDGSLKPQLALSSEVSEDGLTYTIKLREGVQWQKGYGEFTSEDVKFTIERQSDPEIASTNAGNLNVTNIESIECPDAYTVVIKLKAIDVDFLTRLSMYYSLIVCKAYSDKEGKAALNKMPVGTGAFEFDNGTLAVKTEVVAFKDWWGDREGGNIDRIVCTYITDANTMYTAFEMGELDFIPCSDLDKTEELVSYGFNDVTATSLSLLYIGANMQLAPFDNEKVREALFCAIDPQYFIDNLYYGTETIPGSYIPPISKYAVTDYFKPSYDPEKAKALLAEAGYPNGVDVELWGGNDELGQAPVIIAADMLQKSGFNVTIQLVDFGVYIDKVRNGQAALWCFYNSTSNIADDTISRYKSEFYPGNNWSGICDEEYDKLVNAGINAKTEAEKAENFAAAQKRLMDLNVLYPVATKSVHTIYQPGITGMKTYGDRGLRFITVVK